MEGLEEDKQLEQTLETDQKEDIEAKQTPENPYKELLTDLVKEIRNISLQNPARQVETKNESPMAVMTPADHIEKIYTDIVKHRSTYKNPERMKDYETAIWILKRRGFKNDDIAEFILN